MTVGALARRRWKPFLWAGGWAFVTAGVGGALTIIGPWYYSLAKPPFQPPDWAFGPVWTIIFVLAAVALASAWVDAPTQRSRCVIASLFVVNGVLNAVWSLLFFTLQRPDWALVEVPLLWLACIVPMAVMWGYSRRAVLYMIPYPLWVGYAAAINWAVVDLNGPFA
jgi:benzodiazapine receptor